MLHLAGNISGCAESPAEADGRSLMSETLEEMERRVLTQVLQATRGDVTSTAAQLGISPATVYRKVRRFGIQLPS
jgi:transcriptional regulator of acetoin/glycerol metabolism